MTDGWPFLVARGRTHDYRAVLVPDFLAERGMQALLADTLVIGEPEAPPSTTVVERPGIGALVVTSRAGTLRPVDLDGRDTRDEHGRALEYLYGIVSTAGTAAPDDLDGAREHALASYRRFMADEDAFTVEQSAARPLSATWPVDPRPAGDRRPTGTTEPSGGAAASGRRLPPIVLVGVLVVALVVVLAAALARPGSGPIRMLTIEPVGPGECGTTVTLRPRIELSNRATVAFRWTRGDATIVVPARELEPDSTAGLPTLDVRLDDPGDAVHLTADAGGTTSEADAYTCHR